jgi:hypothetical protein
MQSVLLGLADVGLGSLLYWVLLSLPLSLVCILSSYCITIFLVGICLCDMVGFAPEGN